jgi:hypothetical protein
MASLILEKYLLKDITNLICDYNLCSNEDVEDNKNNMDNEFILYSQGEKPNIYQYRN